MEFVGAGPGSHVDHTTGVAAKLGAVTVGLHAEFRGHIRTGHENRQIANGRVSRNAVEVCSVLVRGAAANLVVASREDVLARERVAFGGTLRDHPRNQSHQVEQVTSVHRQFLYGAVVYRLAEVGIFRLQQRRGGGDFHRLSHLTKLHPDVSPNGAGNRDFDRRNRCAPKPGKFHFHTIGGRNEIQKLVASVIV